MMQIVGPLHQTNVSNLILGIDVGKELYKGDNIQCFFVIFPLT